MKPSTITSCPEIRPPSPSTPSESEISSVTLDTNVTQLTRYIRNQTDCLLIQKKSSFKLNRAHFGKAKVKFYIHRIATSLFEY